MNKFDLLKGNKVQKEKKLEEFKKKIEAFFQNRKVEINDIFITCGETVEGFANIETYNNTVAEMILKICTAN